VDGELPDNLIGNLLSLGDVGGILKLLEELLYNPMVVDNNVNEVLLKSSHSCKAKQ
jgi:hypothetical protein